MQIIENYFQQLAEHQSSELLLAPFTQPRFRSNRGWMELGDISLGPSEIKEILMSVLSEAQRETLSEKGLVSGSVGTSKGFNINFSITKHKLGYSGLLKRIRSEIPEDEKNIYPSVLLEQGNKNRGLVIVAGPAKSGRSHFISHLVEKRNSENFSLIALVESAVQFIYKPAKSIIYQLELGFESMNLEPGIIANADAVIIDHVTGVDYIEKAVELVESGKLVVLAVSVDSFSALIRRIESQMEAGRKDAFLYRLADVLLTFVNCRLLQGVQESHVAAQEVYIFNSVMKDSLKRGDLAVLEKYVSEFGEKVGMKTLNQALAALAVRRRVDLKQAFFATYDPEGLDQLFSKMGV